MSASLWAGALLILANLLIVVLGGYQTAWTWIIVILYFTTVHATLVLLGIFGLARALAGQPCRYPWSNPAVATPRNAGASWFRAASSSCSYSPRSSICCASI